MLDHRFEGTPISLTITIKPNSPIEPANLARTLLQTQVRLRRYIMTHYHANEDVLFPRDDPYKSEEQYTDCFFGVAAWPLRMPKRLTYGMLEIATRGIVDVVYRQERYAAADFFIVDDAFGEVGVGRIARDRPGNGEAVSALRKRSIGGSIGWSESDHVLLTLAINKTESLSGLLVQSSPRSLRTYRGYTNTPCIG